MGVFLLEIWDRGLCRCCGGSVFVLFFFFFCCRAIRSSKRRLSTEVERTQGPRDA